MVCDHNKIHGGRAQVVTTYHYLLPYDENKDMGYVDLAETGAIIPLILPLM